MTSKHYTIFFFFFFEKVEALYLICNNSLIKPNIYMDKDI